MSAGLTALIKESLTRVQFLKDIQLMSLAKSLSVLSPGDMDAFRVLRTEARRRGHLLEVSRGPLAPVRNRRDLDIAWENSACMVLNKPQGMVVSLDGDLDEKAKKKIKSQGKSPELNRLLSQEFSGLPILDDESFAHGILHRLDKDTTGAILVAKTFQSFFDLRLQFAAGKVEKEYLCLVEGNAGTVGEWRRINRRIETVKYVDADKHLSFLSRTVDVGGKHARTDFMPLATYIRKQDAGKKISLLRIKLLTGRTHQIRVHVASEKLPLLFDDKYGNGDPSAKFFLHANKLTFLDPESESEERREVELKVPPNMRAFIESELELVGGDSLI